MLFTVIFTLTLIFSTGTLLAQSRRRWYPAKAYSVCGTPLDLSLLAINVDSTARATTARKAVSTPTPTRGSTNATAVPTTPAHPVLCPGQRKRAERPAVGVLRVRVKLAKALVLDVRRRHNGVRGFRPTRSTWTDCKVVFVAPANHTPDNTIVELGITGRNGAAAGLVVSLRSVGRIAISAPLHAAGLITSWLFAEIGVTRLTPVLAQVLTHELAPVE